MREAAPPEEDEPDTRAASACASPKERTQKPQARQADAAFLSHCLGLGQLERAAACVELFRWEDALEKWPDLAQRLEEAFWSSPSLRGPRAATPAAMKAAADAREERAKTRENGHENGERAPWADLAEDDNVERDARPQETAPLLIRALARDGAWVQAGRKMAFARKRGLRSSLETQWMEAALRGMGAKAAPAVAAMAAEAASESSPGAPPALRALGRLDGAGALSAGQKWEILRRWSLWRDPFHLGVGGRRKDAAIERGRETLAELERLGWANRLHYPRAIRALACEVKAAANDRDTGPWGLCAQILVERLAEGSGRRAPQWAELLGETQKAAARSEAGSWADAADLAGRLLEREALLAAADGAAQDEADGAPDRAEGKARRL